MDFASIGMRLYKSFFNCSQEKFDLIESVRDVMIQEIMNIEKSEFEGEAVDMDNIAFASKLNFETCEDRTRGRLVRGQLCRPLCRVVVPG